jgi:hypothetical protein
VARSYRVRESALKELDLVCDIVTDMHPLFVWENSFLITRWNSEVSLQQFSCSFSIIEGKIENFGTSEDYAHMSFHLKILALCPPGHTLASIALDHDACGRLAKRVRAKSHLCCICLDMCRSHKDNPNIESLWAYDRSALSALYHVKRAEEVASTGL